MHASRQHRHPGLGHSVIPSISINARYALAEHVSLTGGLETSFLPKSVTNSPIVKRKTLTSAVIGLRYEF